MDFKKYKSNKNIQLVDCNRTTETVLWRKDKIYQAYWKISEDFGKELYIETDINDHSVVSERWLRENEFEEVQ